MNWLKTCLTCSLAAGLALPAAGQYIEVFSEAEAANGDPTLTFLETVTTASDGTAYATLRDTTAADIGGITAFDGSGFTTIMTPADWAVIGSTNDYAAGNGAGIFGGNVRAVSFFDNNIYEVDITDGTVTEVVSTTDIALAVQTQPNLSAVNETWLDGTIYAVESASDQLISVDLFDNVSVEIGAVDFAALLGGTSIGGLGVNGSTLYLGSNSSDSLVTWNTVTDTGSTLLTTAEIESVTDDIDGRAGFGDIFYAPDGLVYFYESDSDYLLSFNPLDAANTLSVVLTKAEFNAGPGSSTINQLSWYEGNIAWADTGLGYYTIPEPTTAGLLGLGALVMLRRRRAA